jgi:hypothetical protein
MDQSLVYHYLFKNFSKSSHPEFFITIKNLRLKFTMEFNLRIIIKIIQLFFR